MEALKHREVRAATPKLSSLLAGFLNDNPLPVDVIVPVPLRRRRLRNRGFKT